MEMFRNVAISVISLAAVWTDIRMNRIPNGLIGTGLFLALVFQLRSWGLLGIILFLGGVGLPVLILGGLYYFRMLGAGDIKLFAVLGGFLGCGAVLSCMTLAFLIGGAFSLGLLLLRGNLAARFWYFWSYVTEVCQSRCWKPYRLEGQEGGEFCFTVPIFFSVLCLIGGLI